jgi:hypothetical protein
MRPFAVLIGRNGPGVQGTGIFRRQVPIPASIISPIGSCSTGEPPASTC